MRGSLAKGFGKTVRAAGAAAVSGVYGLLISALAFSPLFSPSMALAQESSPESGPESAHKPAAGGADAPKLDAGISMQSMEDYYGAVQEMYDQLPRDSFEPAVVVREVGGKPDDLRAWVSENIAWVPYKGHLRSPSAVIMDRTGNSLDQAVLLVQLLRLAGHQPRLAMAEVDADWWTRHLVSRFDGRNSLRERVEPQSMEIPDGVKDPAQRGILNDYITARQKTLLDVIRRTEAQRPVFQERLAKEAAAGPVEVDFPAAHWWVVLEEAGNLERLDPTGTPGMEADRLLTPEELPESEHQSVELRIRVQQWKNGRVTDKDALRHTLRAAEIGNGHLQIGFGPQDVSVDMAEYLKAPDATSGGFMKDAAAASHWVPYIQTGDEVVTEFGFTASGDVNRDHENSAQGAALRDAVGLLGGLGGAAGGDDAAKGTLTRVWIEFSTLRPGGKTETSERVIYEADFDPAKAGPTVEQKARRGLSFVGISEVLIQTSILRRDYVTSRALAHELGNRTAMLGALHYANRGDAANMQKSAEKLLEFPEELYNFALTRWLVNPSQQQVFIGRPNVHARHRWFSLSGKPQAREPQVGEPQAGNPDGILTEGFDLIQTRVASIPGAKDPRALRMEQGVVDSVLEAVLSRKPDREIVSASDLLQRIPAEEWRWIDTPEDLAVWGGDLDSKVYQRLQTALEQGESVFVPRALADLPVGQAAWWEYSPESGDVVGRIAYGGWGGTGTEYLVNLYVAKAAMMMLAVSIAACADSPGFGCIACNFITATIIVAGIFAPGPGWVAGIVVANMAVTLGCGIATA